MSTCKNPVCSCCQPDRGADVFHQSMMNLIAEMVRSAISDGAITESRFASMDDSLTIDEFREEARDFIRSSFSDKPCFLKEIESYWANPTCKGCGVHVDWPREWCFKCKSPKEREEEQRRKWARYVERRNAKKLQR